MALVGVVDKIARIYCIRREQMEPDNEYQAMGQSMEKISYRKKAILCTIPAAFDLVATGLNCMGMIYMPASMWQMLKGGAVIFCGIFSIMLLNRKTYCFNW